METVIKIPFNKPFISGKEFDYIAETHANKQFSGDGLFTKRCQEWLEQKIKVKKALLTHSCTAAIEMGAILANIEPGDEVIMPSFTFVSTANAFVMRGAKPVFVDIRPDTLNIDENKIVAAISSRTKAIVPVHYAGVSCEMDKILDIAAQNGLIVIEDAAHALGSFYKGRALGSMGHIGTFSFHETKNIIAGEGGALLINDQQLVNRAEIVREKGTNRSQFSLGLVEKYTWVDIGSSYLPGEITAAFLWAQMEMADWITAQRALIWEKYQSAFEPLERSRKLSRPVIPEGCLHNGHIYYLLLNSPEERKTFINKMNSIGISCVFHYVPLHNSPYGLKVGKTQGNLDITTYKAERLIRLPIWPTLGKLQDVIIEKVFEII